MLAQLIEQLAVICIMMKQVNMEPEVVDLSGSVMEVSADLTENYYICPAAEQIVERERLQWIEGCTKPGTVSRSMTNSCY